MFEELSANGLNDNSKENTPADNSENTKNKKGLKVLWALLLTALCALVLFPFVWLTAINMDIVSDLVSLLIIFLVYPLLIAGAGYLIFRHFLKSKSDTVGLNLYNRETEARPHCSIWTVILFAISIPFQLAISSGIGLALICGFEGTGCPSWAWLPPLIIFFVPLNYFFFKSSRRINSGSKTTYQIIRALLVIIVIFGLLWFGSMWLADNVTYTTKKYTKVTSLDKKHTAYVKDDGHSRSVVWDGVEGKKYTYTSFYPYIDHLTISNDGSSIAYFVRNQDSGWVVHDTREGQKFAEVGDTVGNPVPLFSANGKHLVYTAYRPGCHILVVDDVSSPCHQDVMDAEYSSDSLHLTYKLLENNYWYFVHDDKKSRAYTKIKTRSEGAPAAFGSSGYTFFAYDGQVYYRVTNGTETVISKNDYNLNRMD